MTFKIFVTGATGYIAGDALHLLAEKHPEYEYAALVRTEDKAKKVRDALPKVRIVLGSLDDSDVLRKEAAWADLVLHAADAADHEGAARAIAAGLVEGHSPTRPGYWLHTGGTGILTYFDSEADRLGEPTDKVFNDLEGVEEVTNLPDAAFHRNVDKIVLECGTKHADSVRTALVCPPTIYGTGRGPVSGRGRQVYEMAKMVLKKGFAPIVGNGLAKWNNVHVYDLSQAYLLLTEAAASKNSSPEIWGARGYYFAENGEHVWGDLARLVASKAHEMGLLKKAQGKPQDVQLSKDEALEFAGFEAVSWGMNSRSEAKRLKKTLEWNPVECSLEDEIQEILKVEAKSLGL
ncbi:NAD(P)-binding protein [Xylariaceae sp. FL1019]|nr:NAD(P)-binding protein [Xylariaceae sp. FL1019]